MGTRFSIGISGGSRSLSLRLALAAGAVFGVGGRALAQTWVGLSGVDSNWTTTGNWSGGLVPVNNGSANVIFTGSSRLTPNVNVAQDLNSLTFSTAVSPGSFNLTGLGLTLRGASAITNNTLLNQNISCPVTVFNPQTWNAASGQMTFLGQINVNANLTLDGANWITWYGASSGAGLITKNGAGTWLLSGPCTTTGGMSVSNGSLRLNNPNILPDIGLLILTGSGVLEVNGQTDSVGGIASAFTTAQIQLPGSSNLTFGATYNGVTNFAGTISGSALATLTKAGTATTTLSGNNTFPGVIQISGGTLATSTSERLADTCTVVVYGTGVLSLPANGVEHIGFINTGSGNALIDGASATLFAGGISLGSGTCNAHLAGNTELTKNGAGTFVLNNTNSYTGVTRITTDTLVLAVNDALPTSTTVLNGGTLQLNPGISATIGIMSGGGSLVLGGGNPVSTLTCGLNASTEFWGVISGTGNLVVRDGAGQALSGANTFLGALRIEGAGVQTRGTERLPDTCDVTLTAAGPYTCYLAIDTYETVRSLTLAGGNTYGVSQPPAPTTLAVTTGLTLQSGAVNLTLAGPVQMVKNTTGTVTLYRANTFTGGTWLRDGILEIYSDGGLGAAGTPLSFDGGRLRVLSSATINRPVSLGISTLDAAADVTLPSILYGNWTLNKDGAGTLFLPNPSTGVQLNVLAGAVEVPASSSLTLNYNGTTSAGGILAIPGGIVTSAFAAFANAGEIELSNGGRFSGAITNTGIISGPGRIIGAISNSASGAIRVGTGESLLTTGTLTNAGLVQVLNGTIEFTGTSTNSASTGLIFARNAELHFDAGLTNQGSLACSFGTTDIFGDINNQAGAVITISGGSDATFLDDVINNGTLRTSTGGNSVFLGAVSGSGSFPGSGIVFLEGDLRPGNSPGFMSFGGDVVFGSFSTLVEELAGTNLNQYDRTAIAGTAYLDGSLDVRLYGGYIPSGIQSFTILTADQVVGQFQSVNLPLTNPPLRVIYTDTAVLVSNCAADFNNDGVVDFFDYLDFVDAFSADLSTADFNQDSVIDFFDYLDFVDAFSTGC